jgi:hypothetical protein
MPKLLNTTLLVTMSSATPESLGYGSLFTSGSVIYFTSSLGKFDLTQPKGYIIVREYLTGATTTWAVPPNVKYVKILAVAGGGSGGGGAKRATTTVTQTGGGPGGAGGPIVMATFPAAYFTRPSYTVTVGAGANSAPGNSNPAGGNGTSGTQGGGTSLISGSNIVIRATTGFGETAAEGGANDDTYRGGGVSAGGSCTPNTLPHVMIGWYGGHWATLQTGVAGNPTYASNLQIPSTTAEAVGTFSHGMNGLRGSAAGGCGGGMSNATTLTRAGSGSGVVVNGTIQGTGSPGVASTGNAGSSGTADLLDIMNLFYFSGSSTVTSSYGIGSGGCGGAVGNLTGTIGGGNGGAGADIGAAGGGGGACSTGSLSAGNGGAGGDGYMAIIEYY